MVVKLLKGINVDFELARNCEENKEVMRIASQRFKIPPEDKNQCKMLGLWDAVELFEPSRGVPFKLFLSLRVKFRCLKWCHENYDQIIQYVNLDINTISKFEYNHQNNKHFYEKLNNKSIKKANISKIIDDILLSVSNEEKILLEKRFLYNKTLDEIGKEEGVSYETIRKRINSILEKFKH